MYLVSATLMGAMLTFSTALAVLNLHGVPAKENSAALLAEAKPAGDGVIEPPAGEVELTDTRRSGLINDQLLEQKRRPVRVQVMPARSSH